MATMQTENVVDGYLFLNNKDASIAELEEKKIKYLTERMDYSNPEAVLKIYQKAIHDRIFKTPVGIAYLKEMQAYLLKQDEIPKEEILPIPLYQNFGGEIRESVAPVSGTAKKKTETNTQKQSANYRISILFNILLAVTIIVMFVITINASQPNILNYKKVITNQYAQWEQELTQREQAVREKERELQIGE